MSLPVSFNSQLAAIMDVLTKKTIAEITKLVDEGTVVLRLEMRRKDSEIEDLKRTLLIERELRKGQLEAAARVTSDRLHAVEIQVGSPIKDNQEKQRAHSSCMETERIQQHLDEHIGLVGSLVKSEPEEEQRAQEPTVLDTGEVTSNFHIEGRDGPFWPTEAHGVCGTDMVDPDISNTIEKCLQMFSQTDQYPAHTSMTDIPCGFSSEAGKLLDGSFSPVPVKVEPDTQQSAYTDVLSGSIRPEPGQYRDAAHPVASETLTLPSLLQHPAPPQVERVTGSMSNTAYTQDYPVNRNRFRSKRLVNVWKSGLAQKMFICSLCGKGFPRFGQLEAHQLSHAGVKPYRCLECGKCFTQKTRLKTHQSVHTGERPFSCKICGKMFSRQDNCLRHERFHSGLKPYSCVRCGKNFTAVSNLKVHYQQVHS